MSTGRAEDRAALAAQPDLFDGAPVGRGQVGRVERKVAASVRAAVAAGSLADVDAGMAALAVELGRAVDSGSRRGDPYAVAAAARELREALTRLRLEPTARGAVLEADPFDQLMRDLANPQAATDA